jgi:long-chain acyl-CoA synthetase
VDSLEWLNLTLEISQQTGVELSEEAIGRIDTVHDLLREVVREAESGQTAPHGSPLEQPEETLSEYQKRWLKAQGPVLSAATWLLSAINRMVMRILFRLKVEGLEHVPDQGRFIITPNHASYLDPLALGAALGYRRLRHPQWAGWTGVVFSSPLFRLIARIAQAVPIDPERAVVSSLAYAAAVLERQERLIWFPEGQRSTTGRLQPFKSGIGMLVEHFQTPVVPVFIKGTYEAMGVGTVLPRLKPITVTFGRALEAHELEQQGKGRRPRDRIVQALHDRMAELGNTVKSNL